MKILQFLVVASLLGGLSAWRPTPKEEPKKALQFPPEATELFTAM